MVVLHMFDFLESMDPLQSWQKKGILFLLNFMNRGLDHSLLGSGLTASQNTHAVNRKFSPSFIEAFVVYSQSLH